MVLANEILTTTTVTVIGLLVIILLLVAVLLYVKQKLTPSGPVKITIDKDKVVEVPISGSLLSTLGNEKIFLPSACGDKGSCLQCECHVYEGGDEALPTETPHSTKKKLKEGVRLAYQVKVEQDMQIGVPEQVFGIRKWEAKMVSNYNVVSFIKGFVVEIPENMDCKPGGYIQIEIPACEVKYTDIDIATYSKEHPGEPNKFRMEWDEFELWPLMMENLKPAERAYSMASYPVEGRRTILNVHIATSPFNRARGGWMDVNSGVASSYVFSRRPGDKVTISGPYDEFFINGSNTEILYVGGGAGMTPMHSHLYHLFKTLKTSRKVTCWYRGRSKRELSYVEHFHELEREFPNFKFFVVLSEPLPEDNRKVKKDTNDPKGDGFLGFIRNAVIEQYLKKYDTSEDVELYFYGPPMMSKAVQKMGQDFGIPSENIRFNDSGG